MKNCWLVRCQRMEKEVIEKYHLDPESIFRGIKRFANERDVRMARQRTAFEDQN